jgi:hypothetical protein
MELLMDFFFIPLSFLLKITIINFSLQFSLVNSYGMFSIDNPNFYFYFQFFGGDIFLCHEVKKINIILYHVVKVQNFKAFILSNSPSYVGVVKQEQ